MPIYMVRKTLRSLSSIWGPKVTVIQELRDLNTLSLDVPIGSLKTHEIELIEAHENVSKKEENVVIKLLQKTIGSSSTLVAERIFWR